MAIDELMFVSRFLCAENAQHLLVKFENIESQICNANDKDNIYFKYIFQISKLE